MRDTSVIKSILVFSMFLTFPSATIANLVRCQEIAVSKGPKIKWRPQFVEVLGDGSPANSAPAEEIQALLEQNTTCD